MDLPTMEQAAKQEMGTFFEEPHVPFDTVAKIGDPAFEIIRYTEANDVDLIMLPTHGYGTFRSLLLGSVVAKVLHDAHCPVWTAAHTEDPHLPDHLNFKNIMCAIELSKESPELICKAVELSAAFGARLRLVHAVPHAEPNPQLRFDDGFRASLLQHAREEIAEMQAGLGTDLEVCLESGSVADVVRDACLHHDAGLAIIGRGTLTQAFGRLRTNAYGIIRQSPCPVLSV
jgi:nucleotide-binding universal stress UspA family protein